MSSSPKREGYYWFRVSADSPKTMARDFEAIVQVGCDEDSNTYFVYIGSSRLRVQDMAGSWAGPISPPSDY